MEMETIIVLFVVILSEVKCFTLAATDSISSTLVPRGLCANEYSAMRMKNEMQEMAADCCPGYFLNDDGECEECAVGWTGHNCMELCPQGWFGRNCSSRCFCWSEFCDPETGKCLSDTVLQRMSIGLFSVDNLRTTTFAIAFGAVIFLAALISAISMFLAYHYHYRKNAKTKKLSPCRYVEPSDSRPLIRTINGNRGSLGCDAQRHLFGNVPPTSYKHFSLTTTNDGSSNGSLPSECSSLSNGWQESFTLEQRDRFKTMLLRENLGAETVKRSTGDIILEAEKIQKEASNAAKAPVRLVKKDGDAER